jgi:predicted nucleic acid-binding protein
VDSSALVQRYVNETGSVWWSGLVTPAAGNDIYSARIPTVEVMAALTRRAAQERAAQAEAELQRLRIELARLRPET